MFMFMGLRMVTYDKYIIVHKFRMRGYSRKKSKSKVVDSSNIKVDHNRVATDSELVKSAAFTYTDDESVAKNDDFNKSGIK